MIQFICLFFPGIISVMIIKKRKEREISHQQFLSYYVLFTLFINLTAFIVLSLFFSNHQNIYSPDAFNPKFAAKYILLLSFLAVISAYSIRAFEYIRYSFILRLWHRKIDKSIVKKLKARFVIKDTFAILILFLLSFLLFGVNWLFSTFSFLSIDELVFHLMVPLEGAGKEIIYGFIKKVLYSYRYLLFSWYLQNPYQSKQWPKIHFTAAIDIPEKIYFPCILYFTVSYFFLYRAHIRLQRDIQIFFRQFQFY